MAVYEKDDLQGQGQAAWFAKADITARAKAAYTKHRSFFDADEHKTRVGAAVELAKSAARLYSAVYETARIRKNQPMTEIKLNKVEFARGARNQLVKELESLGFAEEDFEYRVRSQSFRIFVR